MRAVTSNVLDIGGVDGTINAVGINWNTEGLPLKLLFLLLCAF